MFSIDRGHKLAFNDTSGRTEVFRALPVASVTDAANKESNYIFMHKRMHIDI